MYKISFQGIIIRKLDSNFSNVTYYTLTSHSHYIWGIFIMSLIVNILFIDIFGFMIMILKDRQTNMYCYNNIIFT